MGPSIYGLISHRENINDDWGNYSSFQVRWPLDSAPCFGYQDMNENQLKTRIFILKSIDVILVIALTIAGIYSVFYAPNKEFMIILCLVGLFLVNTMGKITNNKVAIMGVQLDILIRDKKKEEQRTLMGTRHTTARATKNTSIHTNPTTKKWPRFVLTNTERLKDTKKESAPFNSGTFDYRVIKK